jgi:hypothetical protein
MHGVPRSQRFNLPRLCLGCLCAALALACTAEAKTEQVGMVELTIDGVDQTWYVLQPGSTMRPNAAWVAMGPNKGALTLVAYPEPTVEFVRDEDTGSALPADDTPLLVFSIGFPWQESEVSYTLPVEAPAGPASIMLLKSSSDLLDAYDMSGGPGELRLNEIDASVDGTSSFAGTFHGVLRHDSGDTMNVSDGRFDVRAPFFDGRSLIE